ncbi:MAG: hypothetical protein AAFY34_03700 [Pseudomonadota bacterium]
MKKYFVLASAALALCACETTSSRPYTVSTENIMAFQSKLQSTDQKVQVADFSLAEGVKESMTCRALGALEVAPGKTPVQFIQGAMQDELFNAGAVDTSTGTVLNGRIEQLDFNSFGTGSWTIALNVSSEALPTGYTVDTKYSFKTSYSAVRACQNVIDAFTPAVQELIGKVVAHEQFDQLTGASAETPVAAIDTTDVL